MATETVSIEQTRAQSLRDAESKATELFNEISKTLIRAGVSEKQISDEIHQLGKDKYGVRTHWHKRVIRSGANTLAPFSDNPPERILSPGDILVVDLGPVFEAWEADFGRTYILPPRNSSDDAQDDDDDDDEAAAEYEEKVQLRDALEPMWHRIKTEYQKAPGMTGGELFAVSKKLAEEDGWVWGAHLAGHIVGDFPHERIPKDKVKNYVVEGNEQKMDEVDGKGHRRHWILEVHLRPQHQRWGGFFEQILTVD